MLELFGIPLGTIAQVGTFGLVFIALVGAYVKLKDRGMTHAEVMCGQLTSEIGNLRRELHDCEEKCREDIKKLNEEIFGMRKMHIQEQISFISILLRSMDSPDLQNMLKALERVQDSLAIAKLRSEANDVQGA